MRPARFQEFALKTLTAAPGVVSVEPWNDGTTRPYGLKVTLVGGAQVWPAITAVGAPGEKYSEPEAPVEGEVLPEVPLPDLPAGKIPVTTVEAFLVAAMTNAGSREIAQVYGYSDRPTPSLHPGLGVIFHNGAKINMGFVQALSAGRSPGRAWDVPTAV